MKRLEAILELIESAVGVADVGTDHGMVPVELALSGYPGNLIASDINEMPLRAAQRSAEEAGVQERISFVLADGLDRCDPSSVDCVVVAGMGGDLICSIIDRAEWTMDSSYQLILQPMTKAEVLRFWLCLNGYVIEKERAVLENGKLFRILSVRFRDRNTPMTDAELFTGKYDRICEDPLFGEILAGTEALIRKKYQGLVRSGAPGYETAFYRNILDQLKEMEERHDYSKGHI